MKDNNTFLVVDGHSLLFRAFYALDESKFSSGSTPTNAVFGFFTMLCEVVKAYKPYYIAVAFDTSGGTFRNKLLPCYKAQRPKTPEGFSKQLEIVKAALGLLDVKWFIKQGFEGDDIVASLSRQGEEKGFKVLIVSGDKDVFQLIDEKVSVIFPGRHFKDFSLKTPASIEETYSIPPSLYPDLAALRGEGADNIPGVKGVGDKIAAKWLLEFGSLKNLLDQSESIKGVKGEELRKDKDQVLLNRKVNELVQDLTFPVPVLDMHPSS
ncbi:MAG: DNA polymerase I, partial [Aeriscardovia sp.]|nr:DNA polymerase I [Aeriscardovia sp.]